MSVSSETATTIIWRSCSWCGQWWLNGMWHRMKVKPTIYSWVTHGICPECHDRVAAELKESRA